MGSHNLSIMPWYRDRLSVCVCGGGGGGGGGAAPLLKIPGSVTDGFNLHRLNYRMLGQQRSRLWN